MFDPARVRVFVPFLVRPPPPVTAPPIVMLPDAASTMRTVPMPRAVLIVWVFEELLMMSPTRESEVVELTPAEPEFAARV